MSAINEEDLLSLHAAAGEYAINDGFSVILPEKLSENKWNVYRSAKSPFHLVDGYEESHIKTLHDNFEHAVAMYGDCKFLGTRVQPDGKVGNYQWITYKEAAEIRAALGSGLSHSGVSRGDRIGLYLINRPEWILADLACLAYGFVTIPLYDTLGPDSVRYIINHAEISVVFCTRDKLATLLECLPLCPNVRKIVVIGASDSILPLSPFQNMQIESYSKLEAIGKSVPLPFNQADPLDMVTICYTSGTTGVPKGAMLSNYNIVASSAGISRGDLIQKNDIHLCYLPLAHIYERLNIVTLIHYGASIGFYQGDVLKIMEDLDVLKPTLFASVPRLYNRIYDKIRSTVKQSGGLREYLFNVAFNAKKKAMENGKAPSPIWDKLVFNKVKARLGGRVRIMITGASPISKEVFDFLKICFGAVVVEGYGMTETTCTISSMDISDNLSGHVGSPNTACEVKLFDVPEMEYLSSDKPNPRGEICVRGPIVFMGYFKDEKQTREILDSEGWLHTGDIGMWLPGGRLKIIDRKKNIFKLSQGEYIAPEKIEGIYQKSAFIAQCFVHGDSLNASLVAIVVIDPEVAADFASKNGLPPEDIHRLCEDPVLKKEVLADMDRIGAEAKLRGFEYVKNVHLVADPFTLENGLLTPTFKIKRPQAKAYYAKEIASLYHELLVKESQVKSRL